jgi:D-alanyl-D-alanine carboxypeptidase
VERVTGDRLAAQLHQRILAPLKLTDTELPGTQQGIRGPHVHGYAPPDQSWLPSDGPAGPVDVTQTNPSWSWAAGAMVSSATDLARFYQALLDGRLLGPGLLEAMQTTVDASEQFGAGAGYGLGLLRLPWAATARSGGMVASSPATPRSPSAAATPRASSSSSATWCPHQVAQSRRR